MTFKSNENEFLAVGVPLDASEPWIHVNTVCVKLPNGFKEVYNAGPVFTEAQQMESLECTHEILGSLFTKENRLDFEVKEEWVESQFDDTGSKHYRDYLVRMCKMFWEQTAQDSFITLIMSELKKEFPLEELPDRILILRLIAAGGTRVSASAVGDK